MLAGAAGAVAAPLVAQAEATSPAISKTERVELTASSAMARLRPEGPETAILRYGGFDTVPVLHLRQNETRVIRFKNELDQATSLRWYGIRGLSFDDTRGHLPVVPPKAGADLSTLFSDAGTYLFRPQPSSVDQAAHGLTGVLVVGDDQPPTFDQDLVLLLSDWQLDTANQPTASGEGETVIAVNHAPAPASWTARPGARVRMRLANGSTHRVMVVACDGAKPQVIAIDGQPSDLFSPVRNSVPIGPGARFDIAFDLPRESGQAVALTLKGTERVGGQMETDGPLATVRTDGVPLELRPPLKALPANPALPREIALERSKRADLTFGTTGGGAAWTVNGVSGIMLPPKPLLRMKRGGAVTLGLINGSDKLIPLRVSGQALRLLHAKDDGWEPYWRESVLLPPQSRNHVAFVADVPGHFLIESGFDAQVLAGLRCWFEVI